MLTVTEMEPLRAFTLGVGEDMGAPLALVGSKLGITPLETHTYNMQWLWTRGDSNP